MTQLVQRKRHLQCSQSTCWILQLVCEVDLRNCKFVVKLMHELASSSSIELEQFIPIASNQAPVLLATVSL